MDGRIQRKVYDYLQTSLGVRNIDTITTAGMVRHLAVDTDRSPALLSDLAISTTAHKSNQIAVVAHHDCAGNPTADKTQKEQVGTAIGRLRESNPGAEIIGLWLDSNWIIEKIIR